MYKATLTSLCTYLKNWFNREQPTIMGEISITNGAITTLSFIEKIQDGQYFRIAGSVFNDGVHQFRANKPMELHDEVFVGVLSLMAVPQEVLDIATEIEAWNEKYKDAVDSPFNSESFGGYSYSKGNANGSGSGGGTSWQSQFASRLSCWRKL